ncbi:MAG TPA: pyridoxine 5'-phosphate synthase [candidate division Zixibacteria bacterium]|nr:pyridoxine 5'-phosphate synthase [candidate division Zixibacteria bacterium]
MSRLSVNIDHVATLRQTRSAKFPDPVHAAVMAEQAGADGITLHLRGDRRHIADRDVYLIRQIVTSHMTLEISAKQEMIDIALQIKPDMVTLVPERTGEQTTERGFDLPEEGGELESPVEQLATEGIIVALFVNPTEENMKTAAALGADYVELNTTYYAEAESFEEEVSALRTIEKAAHLASKLKLGVAAGHALNYRNVTNIAAIEPVEELSIGHSIIARAVFVGIEQAVREMKSIIRTAREPRIA